MSNTTSPAAPKAKLADLPGTGLKDDADSEKGTKTFDDDSASTSPATPSVCKVAEEDSYTAPVINDEELHERNLALFKESIVDRPLVDIVIPISELRDEYKNPAFIEQINWLEEHGYHSIRRTRGDGDCFYRSFAFAFVERFFHVTDINKATWDAKRVLEATLRMFKALSFEEISYEVTYHAFRGLIEYILHGGDGNSFRERFFMKTFQDLYDSNSIVSYMRLVTAAQIQLVPDDYAPFLTNQDIPDSEEILEPQDFCARFVLPLGKEADDVQISALCRAFQINLDIAYVDGREDHNQTTAQKVRLVPFRSDIDEGAAPISLLYRPGHYDILVGKYHG